MKRLVLRAMQRFGESVTGEVALINRDGEVAGSATIAGDIDASAPRHSC